jgi:hypothetical protein
MLPIRVLLAATILVHLFPVRLTAQRRDLSLVVLLAVDQLRPDYLPRFDRQFTGGFRRLLDRGAVYDQGRQLHAITETAPGHATLLSGRVPARTGIVSNEFGVEDASAPVLGDPQAPGASPRNFRGTALFDWMLAGDPEARVLSVSRKDRSAILTVGRARGAVYWYRDGRFSTSRYYADSLPGWVRAFNARRSAERLAGTVWRPLLPASEYAEPDDQPFENGGRNPAFPHPLPAGAAEAARQLRDYPWMDSLTLEFALEGVRRLRLGRRGRPDLLSVGLSATDPVGHDFGPDSRELHDHLLRLDRWLGRFLDSLAVLVPGERTVVVLTADHGVQSLPEWARANGKPGGRVWLGDLAREAGGSLARRHRVDFGLAFDGGLLLADTLALHTRGVDVDSLARALAGAARARRGVRRVFTPASLRAAPAGDPEATLWRNQLPPGFGWLVAAVIEPGYVWSLPDWTHAQHGSTAPLDVAVPIVFLGPGIRPRRISLPVRTVDIAPTLAGLLGVTPTEPLDGRVLPEIAGATARR